MELLPEPFSKASSSPAIVLLLCAAFSLLLDHGLGLHLQLLVALHHLVHGEDSLLFLLAFDLFFAWILHNDPRRVDAKDHILHVVAVFKLLWWVWRLDKGTLSVAELTNLIIAPEHKCTEVVVGYTMSPAARDVIYHQSLFCFVE